MSCTILSGNEDLCIQFTHLWSSLLLFLPASHLFICSDISSQSSLDFLRWNHAPLCIKPWIVTTFCNCILICNYLWLSLEWSSPPAILRFIKNICIRSSSPFPPRDSLKPLEFPVKRVSKVSLVISRRALQESTWGGWLVSRGYQPCVRRLEYSMSLGLPEKGKRLEVESPVAKDFIQWAYVMKAPSSLESFLVRAHVEKGVNGVPREHVCSVPSLHTSPRGSLPSGCFWVITPLSPTGHPASEILLWVLWATLVNSSNPRRGWLEPPIYS